MLKKIFLYSITIIIITSSLFIQVSADWIYDSANTYYADENGDYLTGWQNIDDARYYFRKNGEMISKSAVISGVRYKFNSNGTCEGKYTGWTKKGDTRFYYVDGIKQTGWCKVNENWYYFKDDGSRVTGKYKINGETCTFSSTGKWDNKAKNSSYKIALKLEKKLDKTIYGGCYVSDEIVVVDAVDLEATKEAVKKYYPDAANIVYHKVTYSYAQMETVIDIIRTNYEKYGIHSWGIVIGNQVEVMASEDTQKLRDFISGIENNGCINLIISDGKFYDD